eukprot:Em0013g224a
MLAPAAPSGTSGSFGKQRTPSQQSLPRSKSSSPPPPSNASPQQERKSQGNIQPPPQASPPPRDSPQLDTKNPTNGASKSDLVTVPLDSPVHSASAGGHWQRPPASSTAGWNDPPMFQKSSARSSFSVPGELQIRVSGWGTTTAVGWLWFHDSDDEVMLMGTSVNEWGSLVDGGGSPSNCGGFPPATSKGAPGQPPPPHYGQPPPPYTTAPVTAARQPSFQQADSVGTCHAWNGVGTRETALVLPTCRREILVPILTGRFRRLEEALLRNGQEMNNSEVIVRTDGGRYDVDLHRRVRRAVYWAEPPSHVKRCSWFFKGDSDTWYLPYEEDVAAKLEAEFLSASISNIWNRRVELAGGHFVVMHSRSAIVQYAPAVQDNGHPKVVLRGFMEVDKVEQGKLEQGVSISLVRQGKHLFGGAWRGLITWCSLCMVWVYPRSWLQDPVDDFREVAQLMLKTHHFEGQASRDGDGGGRVEFLPVHWHGPLRGDDATMEGQVKAITLASGTRLRDFTNSTLLDFLLYTSPAYYENIINEAAKELNQLLAQFKERNPYFRGTVSIMGHSLGSCILFDLLRHQGDAAVPAPPSVDRHRSPEPENSMVVAKEASSETTLESALESLGLSEYANKFHQEKVDFEALLMLQAEDFKDLGIPLGPKKKLLEFIEKEKVNRTQLKAQKSELAAKQQEKEKEERRAREELEADLHAGFDRVKFVHGTPGIGLPFAQCTKIDFAPRHFFAVGSPVGFFLGVRMTFICFLPPSLKYDPVAYRVEPLLVDPCPKKALLMPHHKGRKRFHLEQQQQQQLQQQPESPSGQLSS